MVSERHALLEFHEHLGCVVSVHGTAALVECHEYSWSAMGVVSCFTRFSHLLDAFASVSNRTFVRD